MARQPRKRSVTGIYHIMLRGIDKRNIFLDEEDRDVFLERLLKVKNSGYFELYGYCLMDNHVHLLIKEIEEVGTIIKRITVGYVYWHNNKYDRIGHLFQNRYKSESVETEKYLITVLRYIHQNPIKAGIVKKADEYTWSSHKQYVLAYQKQSNHIDVNIIKYYFKNITEFECFTNEINDDNCLDYQLNKKITDYALKQIVNKDFAIDTLTDLSIDERNKIIKEIHHETGASIRQLGRVLGVGKAIVEHAIK